MVMVARNNNLVVWPVMMVMMASDRMNNILVIRRISRERGITIDDPQTTAITVMVVMVVVVVVRCARVIYMVI